MKPKRLYSDYLLDIVDHSEKAMRFLRGVSFDDFQDNEEKTFAVVRALEVIGEAARHIPKSIRDKHPEVPWKKAIGMRDKVVHEYFGVNLQTVWRTVHEDPPPLRDTVKRMLEGLPHDQK